MRAVIGLVVVFSVASTANASVIRYEATRVAGSTLKYDYSVENDSLAGSSAEFSGFFELGLFDALAPSDGIAAGAELIGFSVRFDWLGTETRGSQAFVVVDPQRATTGSARTRRRASARGDPPRVRPPTQRGSTRGTCPMSARGGAHSATSVA